ncbi:MAG: signal peptide peptidase SppA [Candidatus Marinimicrobia bacterium]|nr:signal peptide peptidase SppA [Candidatus Neomarinimicrobiota bacterium]
MKKSDRFITIIFLAFLAIVIFALFSNIHWSSKSSVSKSRGNIAVVDIKGVIVSAEKIAGQLIKYSQRSNIKGIIIRIDSPGGGSAAFQEIYREIRRVRESGIPVIASIASVGASGGYYAALGATKIMANPGSIVGSIGVIVDFPVAVELLNKIGIDVQTVKSGQYKDIGSPYKEFTREDEKQLDFVVQDIFDQFVTTIADERGLLKKELLKISDGRIFTGSQAKELSLIDTLGTFEDAVLMIAEMAGIQGRPKLVFSQKQKKTLFDILFSDIEEVISLITPIPTLNYIWR